LDDRAPKLEHPQSAVESVTDDLPFVVDGEYRIDEAVRKWSVLRFKAESDDDLAAGRRGSP